MTTKEDTPKKDYTQLAIILTTVLAGFAGTDFRIAGKMDSVIQADDEMIKTTQQISMANQDLNRKILYFLENNMDKIEIISKNSELCVALHGGLPEKQKPTKRLKIEDPK